MTETPNPYAAPRADSQGERASTDRHTRLVVLVAASLLGPFLSYVAGDLLFSPFPETRSPAAFLVTLACSVLFIPFQGGVAAPLLFSPVVLSPATFMWVLLLGGLLFWPGYGWLAVRWVRTGHTRYPAALLLWLFLGYFRLVERFIIAQGV